MAQVCPVVGTTTTVLPPDHPQFNSNDGEARCPVTNAKVEHHNDVVHSHPSAPGIPTDARKAMDASQCPALKNKNTNDSVTTETCPVVGRVSAMLPPSHPNMTDADAGKVCPATNAKLEHHRDKVHMHPAVSQDAAAQQCPVAKHMLK